MPITNDFDISNHHNVQFSTDAGSIDSGYTSPNSGNSGETSPVGKQQHNPFDYSSEIQVNTSLLDCLGDIWARDPEKHKPYYRLHLDQTISHYGFKFLELFSVLAMYRTIKDCVPSDTNFFLVRLLYLAHRFGLLSRHERHGTLAPFAFNVCASLTFGKRLQINAPDFHTFDAWIMGDFKSRRFTRFSSHALKHKEGELVEKLSLRECRTFDKGLHLALYGKGSISPFTGHEIKDNGHFGHACIVKKHNSWMHSTYGGMLVGIESSGPFRHDEQRYFHGLNCSSNPWSAFFMPKFGDSTMEKLPINERMLLPNDKVRILLIDLMKIPYSELLRTYELPDAVIKRTVIEEVIQPITVTNRGTYSTV